MVTLTIVAKYGVRKYAHITFMDYRDLVKYLLSTNEVEEIISIKELRVNSISYK